MEKQEIVVMNNQVIDPIVVQAYKDVLQKMAANSPDVYEDQIITPENTFQPAKNLNRKIYLDFLNTLLLDESCIQGKENILEFYRNFQNGQSSLILSEHKSNFDVTIFFAVMYRQEEIFKEIYDKIVFVAGRKLNEKEVLVKIQAELFNRVIVVPKSEAEGADDAEVDNIMKINMATQKFIRANKGNYMFLVYPTGTRSRPWDRSTYRGIREAFNYVKGFDQIIFMATNGNCLVTQQSLMGAEPPRKDNIKLIFSKPLSSKDFIESQKSIYQKSGSKEDFKQFVIDEVMQRIYTQKGYLPWEEK